MDKNFGGVVWTEHAILKMQARGIKQGDAWATWSHPDQSKYAKVKGAWIYYKTWGSTRIEVVAKKNETGRWVIISVWDKKLENGFVTFEILIYLVLGLLILGPNPNDVPLSATPTPSPTQTTTPTSTPTATPTIVATPVATTAPTAVPVVNNAPPNAGYSRQSVQTDAGVFTVSIISAEIGSTRVIVDTASASDCGSNCPALSLSDYVSRNGGFAGVNGTYFCPRDYPSCAGRENTFDLLVMNKDRYYFNSANNVYSTNPAVIFGSGYIRFVSSGSQWGRDTGVNGVIMNYPLLVFNGGITFGGDEDPKKGSKGSRSFVANRGNTVYIGVVHSATVAESARVMKALGMDNAMNLDNGGSTALWYGGYKVGPGRAIPNAIIFTR